MPTYEELVSKGATPGKAPGKTYEELVAAGATPNTASTYGGEAWEGLKRGLAGLARLPGALLTPHDTLGATAEQERSFGPLNRLLYNTAADLGQSMVNAEAVRRSARQRGENLAGQTLAYFGQVPIVGPVVQQAEKAGPGFAKFSPETLGAAVEGTTTTAVPFAVAKTASATLRSVPGIVENITARPSQVRTDVAQAAHDQAVVLEQKARAEAHAAYPVLQGNADVAPILEAVRTAYQQNIGRFGKIPMPLQNLLVKAFGKPQAAIAFLRGNAAPPSLLVDVSDLQVIRKGLGDAMASQSVPGVSYKALRTVQNSADDAIYNVAAAQGPDVAAQYAAAQKNWSRFANDFHNQKSLAKGGSPMKRLLQANPEDPSFVEATSTSGASARLRNIFQQYGGDPAVVDQLAKMNAVGKQAAYNVGPFYTAGFGGYELARQMVGDFNPAELARDAAVAGVMYPLVKKLLAQSQVYTRTRPYQYQETLNNPLAGQQAGVAPVGQAMIPYLKQMLSLGRMSPQDVLKLAQQGAVDYNTVNAVLAPLKP